VGSLSRERGRSTHHGVPPSSRSIRCPISDTRSDPSGSLVGPRGRTHRTPARVRPAPDPRQGGPARRPAPPRPRRRGLRRPQRPVSAVRHSIQDPNLQPHTQGATRRRRASPRRSSGSARSRGRRPSASSPTRSSSSTRAVRGPRMLDRSRMCETAAEHRAASPPGLSLRNLAASVDDAVLRHRLCRGARRVKVLCDAHGRSRHFGFAEFDAHEAALCVVALTLTRSFSVTITLRTPQVGAPAAQQRAAVRALRQAGARRARRAAAHRRVRRASDPNAEKPPDTHPLRSRTRSRPRSARRGSPTGEPRRAARRPRQSDDAATRTAGLRGTTATTTTTTRLRR